MIVFRKDPENMLQQVSAVESKSDFVNLLSDQRSSLGLVFS